MSAHITLKGGDVLGPDGLIPADLHSEGGRIVATPGRAVDASGYWLLPGIVDLHGDGFERHLAPRRGALKDLASGLPAVEAELAANGITTAILAQFMSWEGGMRGPDFAEALVDALSATPSATDLHLQLRLETCFPDAFAPMRRIVQADKCRYVVLNDHLPHGALAAGRKPPRLTGQAIKAGRSPEAHHALLRRLHEGQAHALNELKDLMADLKASGVRIGSHDDATPEGLDRMRALGSSIAEFPETRAAAEAARARSMPVIMGAPNVVRGGSHDRKVAAEDLIAACLVDALVSDYHYPALSRAALKLTDAGMPLPQAWRLISAGPAEIMGWSDRGTLDAGLRADIVVLDPATHRIEGVFCAGRITHATGRFADNLLAA